MGNPPKRGEIEDVDVMLTKGRNGKSLSEAAVNRGVQRLLDLGNDVTTIGKKHSMSRTEIKTRSKLTSAPAAIKKRFESGALDLLAVQKIQELEEQGAEGLLDTVIEPLDDNSNATSRNPNMLNNTLERAKAAHATKQELARLADMGAVEAPNDANYSGKYTRSRKELTTEEHVANSHEYTRGKYSEETT